MTKKDFFKYLAGLLLLPGGCLVLLALGVVLGVVFGVAIYIALLCHGAKWILLRGHAWLMSFRKAGRSVGGSTPSVVGQAARLSEDFRSEYEERTDAEGEARLRKWLQ